MNLYVQENGCVDILEVIYDSRCNSNFQEWKKWRADGRKGMFPYFHHVYEYTVGDRTFFITSKEELMKRLYFDNMTRDQKRQSFDAYAEMVSGMKDYGDYGFAKVKVINKNRRRI